MKILFLGIKEWPANSGVNRAGGTGSYCDLLIEGFKDEVESIIVTQKSRHRNKYESSKGVSVYRLETISNRVYKLVVGNLLCALKAYFLIRKKRVDIIHAHTGWAILYAYFLARITKTPLVATPHGDPYGYYEYTVKQLLPFLFINLIKLIANHVFPKADSLVVFTAEDKENLLKHTTAQFDNLRIIETGVKLPAIRNRNNFESGKIRILYVGRLTASKGVDRLIVSLTKLEKNLSARIHVDIVGSGEDEPKLCQLCHRHKLDELVTFHGFIEHSKIDSFYKAADIFLFPSFVEGFSLALLEAMSYGLACVVNDYGLPFDQDEILLTKNNDPEIIANALTKLIANPELIPQYGRRAREIIKRKYSQAIFARKYIDLYEETVNHGDSQPISIFSKTLQLSFEPLNSSGPAAKRRRNL